MKIKVLALASFIGLASFSVSAGHVQAKTVTQGRSGFVLVFTQPTPTTTIAYSQRGQGIGTYHTTQSEQTKQVWHNPSRGPMNSAARVSSR